MNRHVEGYLRFTSGDQVQWYEYNEDGQISDIWCRATYECQSRYYANGENFAYWLNGSMHFQHNDYLGTVHARTYDTGAPPGNPDIAREGTYYSLPWGDGKRVASGTQTSGGTDDSNAHFAELEHDQLDLNSDTDQALNRTYVAAQGSWLQPDPYDGSYDNSDPQSFNRYSYVLNNPLMFSDPEGKQCGVAVPTPTGIALSCISTVIGSTICGPACGFVIGGVVSGLAALGQALGLWAHPQCSSCVTPRPQAQTQNQQGSNGSTCSANSPSMQKDISMMHNAFNKTVKSLDAQGRVPGSGWLSGAMNNVKQFVTHPWSCSRLGCGDQASQVFGVVNNQNYANTWNIEMQYNWLGAGIKRGSIEHILPHQWVTASSPCGANVTMDPWSNTFGVTQ